jgi:hypothetical protein
VVHWCYTAAGRASAATQPVTQSTQQDEQPGVDAATLSQHGDTLISQPGFGETPRRYQGVDPVTGAPWSIEVSPIGRPYRDEKGQVQQTYGVRTYDENDKMISDENVSVPAGGGPDTVVAQLIQPLGKAHPVRYKPIELVEVHDEGPDDPPRAGGELFCEQQVLVSQFDRQGALRATHLETMRSLDILDTDEIGRDSDPERCERYGVGPKWQAATEASPAQLRTAGGVFRAIVTTLGKTDAVAKLDNGEPERFFQKGTKAVLTFDGLENQMQIDIVVREVNGLTGEVQLDFVAGHLGLNGPAIPLGNDSAGATPAAPTPLTTDVTPE